MLDLAPRPVRRTCTAADRRAPRQRSSSTSRPCRRPCSGASTTGTARTSRSPPAGRPCSRCSSSTGCRARAYLVNDHEPEFYPTSVESIWASGDLPPGPLRHRREPVAARSVRRPLRRRGRGVPVRRGPRRLLPAAGRPRRDDTVVFYARAVTPRRAVALGVLALAELKRAPPGRADRAVRRPRAAAHPFPYEHIGVATPEQLAWVYSEATVGLCLSLTNYSLIPQEMLACGLPCVDLEGASASSVFGADGPVELAPFDADALADALERLLDDRRARAPLGGGPRRSSGRTPGTRRRCRSSGGCARRSGCADQPRAVARPASATPASVHRLRVQLPPRERRQQHRRRQFARSALCARSRPPLR